jgi:hypothetical protein
MGPGPSHLELIIMQRCNFRAQKASGGEPNDPWGRLVEDDILGIDGDIETLIRLYQHDHGYTRDKASAALVERLSGLAGACAFLMQDPGYR